MTDLTDKTFSELLALLGWSKMEFSRRIDVHPNTVTNWARYGEPKLARLYLESCCRALGI